MKFMKSKNITINRLDNIRQDYTGIYF